MNFLIVFLICIGLSNQTEFIQTDLNETDISKFCNGINQTFYNHTPFTYLIDEPTLCSSNVFILAYVQSSSTNFERRQLIRGTWASMKFVNSATIKLLFVLGIPNSKEMQQRIIVESENYRDIVQGDFLDTYKNLTLKHIVALHWINKFCSQAHFISKTDDDTFVNIFSLAQYSQEYLDPKKLFIMGHISDNEYPIRVKGYKWTVSKEMYEPLKYPPFTKGFAYVLSQSAVKPLLICSYFEKYLFIDDVFITGLVRQNTNVTLINFSQNYGYRFFDKENIDGSSLDHIYLVGHNQVFSSQWEALWQMSVKNQL